MRKSGVVCNIRLTIKEDGNIISEKTERSHSFVNNFAFLILHGMDGVSNTDYRDISNTARPAALSTYYSGGSRFSTAGMDCVWRAGAVVGIAIGTSNSVFSVLQYCLQTRIAHGSGPGNMYYSEMVNPEDPIFSDPNILLELSRDFANNSGAAITVREIGLGGLCAYRYMNSAETLFIRDVIADTVVNGGQVLNVKYIFKTVV